MNRIDESGARRGRSGRDTGASDDPGPPPARSGAQPSEARIAWTPDQMWYAVRSDDKKHVAARFGCGLRNVQKKVQAFQSTSPGGSGIRHVVDRDVHLQMASMLDAARHEVLAAVAFVSPAPPPVFDHLLAAARRGLDVRLLFRSDNLTGDIVRSLHHANVQFRTLTDLHAKFLITDTTALNGSANFTQASADRASEVATFLGDPALVHALREVFRAYWRRARSF